MLGVILAAGAATRLRPLSEQRPKTLMPVLDVPLFRRCARSLCSAGITDIRVNAHEWAERIEAEAKQASPEIGIEITVSAERDQRLGTAGALRRLGDELDETFLLHNGDIATTLPLLDLLETHRSAGAWGTLAVIPHAHSSDLFVEEGWVSAWAVGDQRNQPGLRWSGVAVFEPNVLELIPDGTSGLYETVLEGVLRLGKGLATMTWEGYWTDVGTPRAYLEANLDALAGSLGDPPAHNHIGPEAETEGATLRHSIVGRGARLFPGTDLERCVVWEGVELRGGHHRDSVISNRGVFRVQRGT